MISEVNYCSQLRARASNNSRILAGVNLESLTGPYPDVLILCSPSVNRESGVYNILKTGFILTVTVNPDAPSVWR